MKCSSCKPFSFHENNVFQFVTFFAVLGASMSGAMLFGQSIGKVALIPFELFLIAKSDGIKVQTNRKVNMLLLWYLLCIASYLSGLVFMVHTGYSYPLVKNAANQIIQIIIFYIPIALLINSSGRRIHIIKVIIKNILYVAKIQALWAFAQFAFYYILRFDLNGFVFKQAFGGMLGGTSNWTGYNNLPGQFAILRVSGLNHDMAFFAVIMVIGYILEKNLYWKLIYVFACTISLSRSGMATLCIVFLYQFLFRKKEFGRKIIAKYMTVATFSMIAFISLYTGSYNVRVTVNRLFMRFATIATGGDGTGNHTGYFKRVFDTIFGSSPIMQTLFGVGLNTSGILLQFVDAINSKSFSDAAYTPWAIESDLAGILTGVGIAGYIYFYFFMAYLFFMQKNVEVKEIVLALVVFGIMYNVSTSTLIQLVYMVAVITLSHGGEDCLLFEKNEKKNLCYIG